MNYASPIYNKVISKDGGRLSCLATELLGALSEQIPTLLPQSTVSIAIQHVFTLQIWLLTVMSIVEKYAL